MTRISSAFNLLKRVGFAALLLGGSMTANAQWYTNPISPEPSLQQTMPDPVLCLDGHDGAFFVSHDHSGTFRPGFIGHIDADGYLSYPDSPGLYQYLLPIDTLGFYSHATISVTRSCPEATAIVTAVRIYLDNESVIQYGGFVFTKFDTLGLTGFEQVVVSDTSYFLHSKSFVDIDANGPLDVYSDSNGGLHVIVYGRGGGGAVANYYEHLNSDGEWSHTWPGIALWTNSNGSMTKTVEDGAGGVFVFVKWRDSSPQFAGQTTCMRFDQSGQPTNSDPVPIPRPSWTLASAVQSEPGRAILLLDSAAGASEYIHRIYKIDTNCVNLWSSEGRELSPMSGSQATFLRSDELGGFFHSFREESSNEWMSLRYDGEAELLAISPLRTTVVPQWADRAGGAYSCYWSSSHLIDPQYVSVYRWDAEFQLAWPDSTLAFLYPANDDELGVVNQIVTDDNALIGAAPWTGGLRLFRVDSAGSLGASTSVRLPGTHERSFQIVCAYPNPFNSTLSISLDMPLHAEVSVTLYDLLGREVDVIYRGRLATNTISYAAPAGLASGVYFVRAESRGARVMRKVVLLK